MRHAVSQKNEDGTYSFFIPSLATPTGRVSRVGSQISTSDSFGSNFANWESADFNEDGKSDLRRAFKWWRRDPLVFRCTKVLCQLANSKLVLNCENDEFKDIVSNWVKVTMPFSFRQAFFLEYFRTGMVPIMKTLIPYIPRDYKSNKIPLLSEDGNIDSKAIASITDANEELTPEDKAKFQKTLSIMSRNAQAKASLDKACEAYEAAKASAAQGLCSPERLEKLQQIVAARQAEWSQGMIPGAYTILNPLSIDIRGPKEMSWLREPYLEVSNDLLEAARNPTPGQASVLNQLPSEVVTQILNGDKKIMMPANILRVIFCDKQPYERYPVPMAAHAFDALEMKYALREMDESTAKATTNRILKVTIGNDTYPELDASKMPVLQQLFYGRGKGDFAMFWNHTLEMEWVEPDLTVLGQETKYNIWNDEIRTAFGISRILTGTSETAGAVGNSVMNFKGVEEEVNDAQDAFLEWLQEEIRMLRAALSISDEVRVTFDQLNMKDENQFMSIINQMVLNNIIDPQTAMESLNFHFPTVMKRQKEFNTLRKSGLFMPLQFLVAQQVAKDNKEMGIQQMAIDKAATGTSGGQGSAAKGGGTPTGGKPKNSPGAANNKNKKGITQKRSIAKLVPIDNTNAALVMAVASLDDEEREDIAARLSIPTEMIMTTAEFKSKYNREPDMTPPWPELTPGEAMTCMLQLGSHSKSVEQSFQDKIAKAKERGNASDKKRGPYVTAQAKADLMHEACNEVLGSLAPEVDSATWGMKVQRQLDKIKIDLPDLDEVSQKILAVLLAKMQAEKAKELMKDCHDAQEYDDEEPMDEE